MDNYLTSANVWAIVWAVIGILISLAGSLLSARFLFPAFAERCAESTGRPVRCGLIGLLAAGAALLILVLLRILGPAAPAPMFLIGGAVILLAITGGGGILAAMGRSIALRSGEAADSWPAQRRAATILALAFLLPVAGWFLVLPLFLIVGLGAAVQNLRSFRAPSAALSHEA